MVGKMIGEAIRHAHDDFRISLSNPCRVRNVDGCLSLITSEHPDFDIRSS